MDNICFPPYYTWAIMTSQDEHVTTGAGYKSAILSRLTRMERELVLMKMTLVVNNSPTLSKLAKKDDDESVLLRIFSNVFDAYYKWLGNDISGIDIYDFVCIIFNNFKIIDDACTFARNYSEKYLLDCFSKVDSKGVRTYDDEKFKNTILETMYAVEDASAKNISL